MTQINLSFANASNDLILWTVVAYSIATLGFAIEFAAGRRLPGNSKVDRIGVAAIGITAIGWSLHVAGVVTRGLAVHRAPWGNMYEFSVMASLVAVTLFLIGVNRWRLRRLGAFILAPLIMYLGIASTVLYAKAGTLVPALHSYWIWIHVAFALTATGAFLLSGLVTILYLLKERWERGLPPLRVSLARSVRSKFGGPPQALSMGPGTAAVAEYDARAKSRIDETGTTIERWPSGLMESIPSAEHLERTANRIITFAFPVWTCAIIFGAIWANVAWSRAWGWDPKETWSFITWLAYAAYLHARATGGWRGRRAATISLIGFLCLIVNFYVVNTLIVGLHSYAGLGKG